MKRLFLLTIVLLVSLMTFAKCKHKKKCCKKTTNTSTQTTSSTSGEAAGRNPNEMWLGYDETQCANPWQFNWFKAPTDADLAGAVQGYLQGQGITVNEIRTLRDKEIIHCEACTCLNGFHYYVKIPKDQEAKLKALKFHEIDMVPAVDKSKE